jgi:MerR family transcriptional regulator, light-induced transcriptional regulator
VRSGSIHIVVRQPIASRSTCAASPITIRGSAPGQDAEERLEILRADGFEHLESEAGTLGGRTALITGPSSGLGRAATEALAGFGGRAILVGRKPITAGGGARHARRRSGRGPPPDCRGDLGSLASVRAAVRHVLETESRQDVLGAVLREAAGDRLSGLGVYPLFSITLEPSPNPVHGLSILARCYIRQTMYTIKQAAARTGLNVPVIRVWERRYGVVQPSRTPAGYRLYDDESIARLVAMRHLVADEGWQPSQAAQRVLEPGVDLQALSGAVAGRDPDRSALLEPRGAAPGSVVAAGADPGSGSHARSLADAFLSAAQLLDVPAMERILDESFASQRFELAIEGVVSPALRAIGSAWASDEIDVGAEHAASETVRRRLARFFDAASLGDRLPQVIVGLPPDGYHEIGALAFAVAIRRARRDVLYLGANVPLESWLRTVRETAAPIVVLGVVTPSDVVAASAVVDALAGTARRPICLVGGPLSAASLGGLQTIRLPTPLDDAVAAVVRLLRPRQEARSQG